MPGNRWIKPLMISGLLLSFMQNSAAGWDCQPTPDGRWVCNGTISPPSEPAQREESPPTAADSKDPAQTVQPDSSGTEHMEAPSQAYQPQPETSETTGPVSAEERDQSAGLTKSEDKAAAPVVTESRSDQAPSVTKEDQESTASTDDRPLTAPQTVRETTEPYRSTAETAAAGASTTADETEPHTAEVEQTRSPDESASDTGPSHEAEEIPAGEERLIAQVDANIDRGLNWNQCYPWATPAPLSFSPAPAQKMLIDADGSVLEQSQDQVRLEGDVQVLREESLLEADSVLYRRSAETLDAEGNVYLEQPGLRLSAAKAHLELARDQGELEQVSYRLSVQGARGDADSASIESRDLVHFKQINYTTCAPGDNGWLLEADELDIDQESGVGTARHAKLRFKGVPFLYLPYASFPIDDRRKSGFLIPSVGQSDRSGTDISAPYYFNIAPNMDATLTPRILSKRGLMLGGEFRYLQEKHKGQVQAEILPDDNEVDDDQKSTRGAFSVQASGRPAPGWTFDTDINYVSDNRFLDDLGRSLAVTSTRHLERLGQIRYTGSDWSILGRTQYFQTIDGDISKSDRPYSRLPQLLFELNRPKQAYGLTYHLQSEYVNFGHSGGDIVKGHRFDLQPGISLPLNRRWGYLTPKASLRYTRYDLENQTPGADDNPDRLLPTFSLDGGLFFERNSSLFGDAIVQTLEPRLFYLYTPYEDQDELPNFDTADVTFSFPSLFRENRFSGTDKIGDANQLTAALTSRILSDSTGQELLRASIGQIYYFRDQKVQLNGETPEDESSSSMIAELASQINREWSLRAGIQWDPHQSSDSVERGLFSLHYNDSDKRVFNTAYNYTRDSVEQTDISGRWPIGNRWSLVGRWTYSQLFDETVQAFAGIEYDNCCWRVRLIGQQLLTDVNDDPENSILLQFQLKGLGGWGNADDEFLEDNISGYQTNR